MQPRPRWLRRWLKRAAVALAVLGVVALLLCTVGWPWVNVQARSYFRWRMKAQTEASAERLPEITDHSALIQQDIHGTNGWEHLRRGCELWFDILKQHETGQSYHHDPDWITSLDAAVKNGEWESYLDEEEEHRFSPKHFPDALLLTEALAATTGAAADCDCIVRLEPEWRVDDRPRAYIGDFFGVLATRVMMLDYLNQSSQRDRELMVLIRVLSKYYDRFSKREFSTCLTIRNEFMQHRLIPLLERTRLGPSMVAVVREARWTTPGKDPKLWLNNAAWTYYRLTAMYEDEQLTGFTNLEDGDPVFPRLRLYGYPGYTQMMGVCTQNAIDARAGVLDLRNPEWVRAYHDRFSWGYNPINGVVG